jgi:protein-S-isoprenylcysteine O-methyltransferase Ste14
MAAAAAAAAKRAAAVAAAAAAAAGLFERHRAGAGDAVLDHWWRPQFNAALLLLVALIAALTLWYCRSRRSPARERLSQREAAALGASLAGSALRLWAMQCLGPLFTFEVAIRPRHALVGDGPYALLLHPSYTGLLLSLGGLLYFLGGPRGALRRRRFWAAALPAAAAAVAARLTNEEAALAGHFGAAWRAHAARRWRLVPLLF